MGACKLLTGVTVLHNRNHSSSVGEDSRTMAQPVTDALLLTPIVRIIVVGVVGVRRCRWGRIPASIQFGAYLRHSRKRTKSCRVHAYTYCVENGVQRSYSRSQNSTTSFILDVGSSHKKNSQRETTTTTRNNDIGGIDDTAHNDDARPFTSRRNIGIPNCRQSPACCWVRVCKSRTGCRAVNIIIFVAELRLMCRCSW